MIASSMKCSTLLGGLSTMIMVVLSLFVVQIGERSYQANDSSLSFGAETVSKTSSTTEAEAGASSPATPPPTIAFLGNSIVYFNDTPRLVEAMLRALYHHHDDNSSFVVQDSCLRGGANLASLWHDGNGMETGFASQAALLVDTTTTTTTTAAAATTTPRFDIGAPTVQALLKGEHKDNHGQAVLVDWDYIVLQDQTQYPTRDRDRQESITALTEHYFPAIQQNQPDATVLFLETWAYQVDGTSGSADLGGFDGFTAKLVEGYEAYCQAARNNNDNNALSCRVIPMATAVAWLHDHSRNDLWPRLYFIDGKHPSPTATWLQACLLVAAVTGQPPPPYTAQYWKRTRYWPGDNAHHLPRKSDAAALRDLACRLVLQTQETCEGAE